MLLFLVRKIEINLSSNRLRYVCYNNLVKIAASWYNEDVMSLLAEAMEEGGLTTLSDAYTINGQPGDFYNCSKSKYC